MPIALLFCLAPGKLTRARPQATWCALALPLLGGTSTAGALLPREALPLSATSNAWSEVVPSSLGTFAKIWSVFYSASKTSQLDAESWPPPTPLEYPGKLCCTDPWCVCWLYAHVFFIYIYIICLFLKGRQKSKSCSSSVIPQNPLAQLQFSGECRCFLARVWPVADRSSEALKMQLLAYFLCTRTPSSAARFPSEGTCSW